MDWSWLVEGLKWIGSLGVFTLGTATITGIIGYIFKTVFAHMLNKQTEQYKVILNKQTEEHKSELQRLTNKHQIIFNKLHEERAVTIKELYSKFVKLEKKMRSLTSLFQGAWENTMEQKSKDALDSYWDFLDFYSVNRIYFSEDICKIIDNIEGEFKNILHNIQVYELDRNELDSDIKVRHEQINVWKANWDRVKKEIPDLKNKIEIEFRKLLGVIEDQRNIK
ncbi:hypothetical protein ACX163_05205 [Bacillus cereus]